MSRFGIFLWAVVAGMLASAPVQAAVSSTMCGGDSNVGYTCNEAAYAACMNDIKPKLCPDGELSCGGISLMTAKTTCACNNLTDKSDLGGQYGCEHTISIEKFKDSYLHPLHERHCDTVLPFSCNQDAYSACMKGLLATHCPNNAPDCEYTRNESSLIGLQMICFCDSVPNKNTDPKSAEMCKPTKSPAQEQKEFANKPVLYCSGYVHTPCNEKEFGSCMQDLGKTFCPNGSGCEGIGPALAASWACENLIDKSTMPKEEFCKNHMSPTALKSELLKEMRK